MIPSKFILKDFLLADSKNYKNVLGLKGTFRHLVSNPISDQLYIWRYIKYLRCCEYFMASQGLVSKVLLCWSLHRLRRYSRITGFQIPPNVIGEGLTIWHWGPIIINPMTRIGKNCTLYPNVLIGHKNEGDKAPTIGDNVFICSGVKIIGNVHIGNNVVIGHNCVITYDIPDNTKIVVCNKYRILGNNENTTHM